MFHRIARLDELGQTEYFSINLSGQGFFVSNPTYGSEFNNEQEANVIIRFLNRETDLFYDHAAFVIKA